MASRDFYGRDPFGGMDDIFNQLMGNMGGYNSENKRYLINGREVTPEEFAAYRKTGKLPSNEEYQEQAAANAPKQDGILAKLGTNLTERARANELDMLLVVIKKFKKQLKSYHVVQRTIPF